MRNRPVILKTLCAAAGAAAVCLAAQDGFIALLERNSAPGFEMGSPNWVVENGVLALKDRTDGKMINANYLWTKQQYGDFILQIEFKVLPERANSGVFIRTADRKDPVQTGIEIQVGNAPADRPLGRGSVGGLYDLLAPRVNAYKPNDWNRYVLTCRGPRITVELNGQITAEANLDQWVEARKNPDGSPNKFRTPLKDFARKGYIGLQDHGSPVWYRNIRIRPLD